MIFQNYSPSAQLKGLIKSYHVRHFSFPPFFEVPSKPFPPRSEQYISFYIRGSERVFLIRDQIEMIRKKSMIIGQSTQLVNRTPSSEFLLIQVPFFPGALYKLTGIPFYELTDKSLDLELVFPQETKQVEERLREAKSYEEMIFHIDLFFITMAHHSGRKLVLPFEKTLSFFSGSEIKKLDELAGMACVSNRQFERLSQKYLGVSPKTMMRINRFSESFICKNRNPHLSWQDIAMINGYEDYQHMVKEFKDFTGFTPNQLWEADKQAPDRVLGLR